MIRIFIADDESPARERLKELLQDIAADVPSVVAGEAPNGIEALERLPASGAQVLLLDIRMPGMDGLELARHVSALDNAPAVVFVTAHDQHAIEAFERESAGPFVRIHRNCLVARTAIRGFERTGGGEEEAHWQVVLDGMVERLPVSRRQWPAVRELIAERP